jgi:hypothetical protein
VAGNFTYTYYAGATASGTPLAGAPTNAGTYTVVARFTSSDPNYLNGSTSATFTISPAALTVTANALSKVYGAPLPALTYTTSAFAVAGDSLSGAPAATALATSDVGQYAITRGTLSNPNYAITFVGAPLSVTRAATTVALDSSAGSANYGASLTFTARVAVMSPGSGVPTGTVTFYDNGAILGTETVHLVNGVAQATLTSSALKLNANAITAAYSGDGNFQPGATSAALPVQANASIILLDPTGKGALTVSGNGDVVASGTVIVDSDSASAVVATGNGQIQAPLLDVTGTSAVSTSGNARIVGQVQSGLAAVADPLASLAVPGTAGMIVQSASTLSISGRQTVTLNPGEYVGGIRISGQADVTLNPGVCYILGGGFSVSGQASVRGTGVMIYNAPLKSGDVISISGTGSVNLTASSSGTYQGIVFFQDRTSTAAVSISGNGSTRILGAVYAARATVNVTGNGGLNAQGAPADVLGTQYVSYDLNVSGNGSFQIGTN